MTFKDQRLEWNGREIVIGFFPEAWYPAIGKEIHGIMIETTEVRYDIFINPFCSDICQRYALGHELAHLYNDHLHRRNLHVRECEKEANDLAWQYYRAYRDGKLPTPPSLVSRDLDGHGKGVPYSYDMKFMMA